MDMALDDIVKKNQNQNGRRRGNRNNNQNDGKTGRGRGRQTRRDGGRGVNRNENKTRTERTSQRRGGAGQRRERGRREEGRGRGRGRGRREGREGGRRREYNISTGLRRRTERRTERNQRQDRTQIKPDYSRPEGRKLFISGLNRTFSNGELQKIFKPFGFLLQAGIHWDRIGNSKGTASIEYDNIGSCKKAIREIDNQVIGGSNIRVRFIKRSIARFRAGGLRLGNRNLQGKRGFNNGNNGRNY